MTENVCEQRGEWPEQAGCEKRSGGRFGAYDGIGQGEEDDESKQPLAQDHADQYEKSDSNHQCIFRGLAKLWLGNHYGLVFLFFSIGLF